MATLPNGKIRYQCILCSFESSERTGLHNHFERDHSRQNYFWCKFCGKLTECLDEFFEHLDNDQCDEIFQHPCGVERCDFSDPQPPRFIVHLKSAHRGNPLLPCKYCRRLFTIPHCLVLHLQSQCCNKPETKKTSLKKSSCQAESSASTSTSKVNNKTSQPYANSQSTAERKGAGSSSAGKKSSVNKSSCQTEPSASTSKLKTNKTAQAKAEGSGSSNAGSSVQTSNVKPSKPTVPSKRKKTEEKSSKTKNARKQGDLFARHTEHSDSDIEDPTWNPLESDELAAEKPRRVGRPRKNSNQVKYRQTRPAEKQTEKEETKSKDACAKQVANVEEETKSDEEEEEEEEQEEVQEADMYKTWEEWQNKLREFKTEESLVELSNEENVENFFKCMHKPCAFSAQNKLKFLMHVLSWKHEKPHRCCYCFTTFDFIETYTEHMIQEHGERRYQCSLCLYRSSNKALAKFHVRTAHDEETAEVIPCKRQKKVDANPSPTAVTCTVQNRNRYACSEPDCNFTTLATVPFMKHFADSHPNTIYYPCSFCTYKTADVPHFLKHFRKHKIFDFECYYCSFGSDMFDDVLLHISINHPDLEMQVLSRNENSATNVNEENTQNPKEKVSESTVENDKAVEKKSKSERKESSKAPLENGEVEDVSCISNQQNKQTASESSDQSNADATSTNNSSSCDENSSDSLPHAAVVISQTAFSNYGRKPKPVDLQRLFINLDDVRIHLTDFWTEESKRHVRVVVTDVKKMCI